MERRLADIIGLGTNTVKTVARAAAASAAMDDTIDQMHQTSKATQLYEFHEFDASMRRIGDIIVQSAELTRDALPLLRAMGQNAAKLNAYSVVDSGREIGGAAQALTPGARQAWAAPVPLGDRPSGTLLERRPPHGAGRLATPSSASPRANSTMPLLSVTLRMAR